ncbi:MAG: DarT ssDNA thymidine ADP-ribosyltransferase family protein [Lachnospiraceae bacterium]|nr:DarT ssDNA thymidine ADP-ribosyltransferase family protein [Lachnospiraceae bacterium]
MIKYVIDKNIEILRNNGWKLDRLPHDVLLCREFNLELINRYPSMFEYVDDSLKNDEEFAFAVVQKDDLMFKRLNESLRSNYKIAKLAIDLDVYNYMYASGEIKNDRKIAMKLLEDYPTFFRYCGELLKDDYNLVLKMVKEDGNALEYASDRLKMDRKIVSAAIGQCGTALRYAPAFADDEKMVLKAVRNRGCAFQYASDRLKADDKFIAKAIKANAGSVLYFARKDDYDTKENKEACKKIAKKQNVDYFVHFTNIRNLRSILKYGIQTRAELDTGFYGQNYFVTDESRLDNMRNTISLSVTMPNTKMFYMKRKEIDANWCVLRMKADTVLDHNCYFFSNNAAKKEYNEDFCGIARDRRNSYYDFMSMFDFNKNCVPSGRAYNVQAEVMCGERIPRSEIDSIVFRDEEYAELFRNDLKRYGIETVVDENYFC